MAQIIEAVTFEERAEVYRKREGESYGDQHQRIREWELTRGRAWCQQFGLCSKGDYPVPHDGSPYCRSGSVSADGARTHCSCDVCF